MRTRLAETGPRARSLVALVVIALVWATVALIIPQAQGAQSVTSKRFGGADRYATAEAIAEGTFKTASFALLARGDDYPDALAGNYLAGGGDGAPILLTPPTQLSSSAKSAFQKLGVKGVIILGGTNAISASVEKELQDGGYQTQRLFGANRYATAAAIAKSLGAGEVGSVSGNKTAIVASGEEFADALAGGPMSYDSRLPTLLTRSTTLPSETDSALTDLSIKHVIILGGTTRITPAVQTQIESKGITTERLAGATRFATAVKIATFETTTLKFVKEHVNLGRGDFFADPLAGGPHGGAEAAPILLAESPDRLGNDANGYFQDNSDTISSIDGFGGTAALSDGVLADAKSSSTCTPPSTSTTAASTTPTTLFPGQPTTAPPTTAAPTTTASTTSTTVPGASTTFVRKTCSTSTSTSSSTSSSSSSTTKPNPCNPFPAEFCPITQTITGGF